MSKPCFKTSFGFGIASGVITTLGLMVGLYSSTYIRGVVLGGVLTIAIADSCSDAVGMHFSEESEGVHTNKEIWLTTIYTFFSKLVVTLSFLPLLFAFSLKVGIMLNILWGFLLLSVFSYVIAKEQNNSPFKAILEHVSIMAAVI
ncbi:MAG: hypothetical protein K1000chlam1_00721, partial [Candidatus Anoxychlamydiales bacterium]|nr:hypothetical protein [Candidatus Anoxychlamydiales bacterium]